MVVLMLDVRLQELLAEQFGIVNKNLLDLSSRVAAVQALQMQIVRQLKDVEPVDHDRLYTRAYAARLLGVHVKTIDRWCRQGTLSAVHLGRRVFVTGCSIGDHNHPTRSPAAEVLKL